MWRGHDGVIRGVAAAAGLAASCQSTECRDLETAAAHVIAQDKLAKTKLAGFSEQESRYTRSAMSAQQSGNLDMTRTFATRIASIREQSCRTQVLRYSRCMPTTRNPTAKRTTSCHSSTSGPSSRPLSDRAWLVSQGHRLRWVTDLDPRHPPSPLPVPVASTIIAPAIVTQPSSLQLPPSPSLQLPRSSPPPLISPRTPPPMRPPSGPPAAPAPRAPRPPR